MPMPMHWWKLYNSLHVFFTYISMKNKLKCQCQCADTDWTEFSYRRFTIIQNDTKWLWPCPCAYTNLGEFLYGTFKVIGREMCRCRCVDTDWTECSSGRFHNMPKISNTDAAVLIVFEQIIYLENFTEWKRNNADANVPIVFK